MTSAVLSPAPVPPPDVPRPISPLARRRAWTEPSVRIWWLLAVLVLVVVGVFAAGEIWEWHLQNLLIASGTSISAKVVSSGNMAISNQQVPPSDPVTLSFDWHGQPQQVTGVLEGRTKFITIGGKVPIRVDANDPTVWTYRTAPGPLTEALLAGLLLLPLAPILAAIAWWRRTRLLNLWTTGAAAMAVVAQRRQSPIAPSCYAVRASLAGSSDRRLYTVYVPASGRGLKPGDSLWIIRPPGRGGRAAAGSWFEEVRSP